MIDYTGHQCLFCRTELKLMLRLYRFPRYDFGTEIIVRDGLLHFQFEYEKTEVNGTISINDEVLDLRVGDEQIFGLFQMDKYFFDRLPSMSFECSNIDCDSKYAESGGALYRRGYDGKTKMTTICRPEFIFRYFKVDNYGVLVDLQRKATLIHLYPNGKAMKMQFPFLEIEKIGKTILFDKIRTWALFS